MQPNIAQLTLHVHVIAATYLSNQGGAFTRVQNRFAVRWFACLAEHLVLVQHWINREV